MSGQKEVKMDYKQKISLSDTVFAQEVDGEMVLLDMNSENYFGLDEVGCSIWQAMQDKENLGEIYESMLAEYDVEPERLESDLLEFIERLKNAGLLKIEK